MYTISMYSTIDTFGPGYKWICLFCSVMYAVGANWGMFIRLNGAESSLSSAPKLIAFLAQAIPTISCSLMFIYLWSLMYLRARSAYKTSFNIQRGSTLFTVKEWVFLVYSVTTFCTTVVVFVTSITYGYVPYPPSVSYSLIYPQLIKTFVACPFLFCHISAQ